MDETPPLQLRFPPFDLDQGNARLAKAGVNVPMTPKAFAVLCTLARRPGQLVTKGELLDAVWGHQHVSESVLKTIVSELRGVLGDDAKQPRYIETASRRGYRFIAALGDGAAADTPGLVADALIGRVAELARARAAWARVERGAKRVIWVAGEAGIGKTTFIDRLVAEVGDVRCGRGQCVEQFGSSEPYLPVLEALAGLCRVDDSLRALMRAVAPGWLAQMPWLSEEAERASLQRELTGSHPDRMLREMGELLDRYAADRPVLLVTEDLHWSDHATVRLIDYVARSRGPARVMWLSSFRPADAIAADHPLTGLRHELRAQGLSEEIALDPFSEREVADYVEARFATAEATTRFVRSLHTATEGLPLFVVNVVDDLVGQGLIGAGGPGGAGGDGAAVFPEAVSQVPPSVFGLLDRRIARLPADDQTLLEAASVCGVEFRCETVAGAVGWAADRVAERCEALVRREQWLSPAEVARLADGSLDAGYRFQHALQRHVLYGRIGAQAKATLHRRVARSLEASAAAGNPISAAELALHFDLGREPASALRHYAAAVESALKRLAPVEAVRLIERALALLPECPQDEGRLQLELVLSARRGVTCPLLSGFGSAESQAAFERARVLCDLLPKTPAQAWVMTGLGWVFFSRGDYAASLSWAHRALAIGAEHDDPAVVATASDLAGYSLAHQARLVEAKEVIERGIAACERARGRFPKSLLRAHDPEVSLRAIVGIPLGRLGLVDQAGHHMEAGIARALALGQPLAQILAYWAAAISEERIGRLDRVQVWADALERLFRDQEMLTAEAPALWFHGVVQARGGDPVGGHALIEAGIARHEQLGRLAGITQPLAFAAEAMVLCGQWERAQQHVEQGLRMAERLGERVYLPDLLLRQAWIARSQGRLDVARTSLRESLGLAREQQSLWLELMVLLAMCELDEAAPEHRLALGEAFARLAEGRSTPLAAAVVALLAGRPSTAAA